MDLSGFPCSLFIFFEPVSDRVVSSCSDRTVAVACSGLSGSGVGQASESLDFSPARWTSGLSSPRRGLQPYLARLSDAFGRLTETDP